MSTQLLNNCQFCSVISQSNGEDPIGTANPCDVWLMAEIPLPWTEERLMAEPPLKSLYDLFHEFYESDELPLQVMPMAIAPDHDYSVPGYTRVLYYRRPAKSFAQFDKQEFLITLNQLPDFVEAVLTHSHQLHSFEAYKQPATSVRDLLVCTHGNVDVACARFGTPIYQKLRQDYAARYKEQLRVWRCSHFGGHQFAPTLVDLPVGQVWGHLDSEALDSLVQRNQPMITLRKFYRGWSGLTQFEQIVEREIWMQQGWDWLTYNKSGQVLAQDSEHEDWDADWAEVRLEFTSLDGSVRGTYEARVEVCGSVMTAWNSGEAPEAVKQYCVSRLVRIA
ncbi:MAG: sucrase ferredoxin [Aphanocapsa sp. GSE-SYN-MK-11-07L]|jgi:hypothetical protein|nr:sucrase ferredoxin [Aphanocapsa sp. GSE-SYN-MK-11-07L]